MRKFISFITIIASIYISNLSYPCMYCTGATVIYNVGVELKRDKLKFINITWIFDERFSGMLLWKYDRNSNREIDGKEKYYIKKYGFNFLAEYDYFLQIHFRGRLIRGFKVINFNAKTLNSFVVYTFQIPVNVKIKSSTGLKIEFGYKNSFLAFTPYKKGTTTKLNDSKNIIVKRNCAFKIVKFLFSPK